MTHPQRGGVVTASLNGPFYILSFCKNQQEMSTLLQKVIAHIISHGMNGVTNEEIQGLKYIRMRMQGKHEEEQAQQALEEEPFF